MTAGEGDAVLPPPPPQPLTNTIAMNKAITGMACVSFTGHAWSRPSLAVWLLVAIQNSSDKIAKGPRIGTRFSGFRGRDEGTGTNSAFAVEDTVMFTTLGVGPETVTGTAGPVQVALEGAPVQLMVTVTGPVPEARAS